MTETQIGLTAVGGAFGAVLGSLLYMLGGRDDTQPDGGRIWWKRKFVRRFLGSLVISASTWATIALMGKWNPWMLALYPLVATGMSLGYGAETLTRKILRRTLFALGVLSGGALLAIILGGNAWWLLTLQIGVGLWSVFLGVKNPIAAASEEVLISTLLTVVYPFYAFV